MYFQAKIVLFVPTLLSICHRAVYVGYYGSRCAKKINPENGVLMSLGWLVQPAPSKVVKTKYCGYYVGNRTFV